MKNYLRLLYSNIMAEPKSKIDDIIVYNNALIDKIMSDMDLYKKDQCDDVILLILEKQIGIINFLKKQIVYYERVGLKIEKDKKAGKKTTLKKMKKVTVDETKNTKKDAEDEEPKKKKSTVKKASKDDEEEEPKKKIKKEEDEEPVKKKGTIKKKSSD